MSAERLFSLIERLPAYDGATAARIHAILEEEKKRNPSHKTLEQPDTTKLDSAAAVAASNPDWVEVVKVKTD